MSEVEQTNAYWHERDQQYALNVYKRFPITIERAAGTRLIDVEGNEYLDLLGGIAVASVGHSHPRIVEAISDQASKLIHVSNFFSTRPQIELCRRLAELAGLDKTFLSNSGTEAVEAAMKIARKRRHTTGNGPTVVSLTGCFHGRTLAAIATGNPERSKQFAPLPEGFTQIERNSNEALEFALSKDVCALIMEPVQGEGGINLLTEEFVSTARTLCDKLDITLIVDEIQAGMGRTGSTFTYQRFGIRPDIVTVAKALGSGFPIGAVICSDTVGSEMEFGEHGSTFGGNALASRAALATLDIFEDEDLVRKADETGAWLMAELNTLAGEVDDIKEVRGIGLMIGIDLAYSAKPLVAWLLENGVVANATADTVLRLVPPLTIGKGELREFLDLLKKGFEAVRPSGETADE